MPVPHAPVRSSTAPSTPPVSSTAVRRETSDAWRDQLGAAFDGLVPEPNNGDAMEGHLDAARLGSVSTYRIAGTPQVVRRVARRPTEDSPGLLKACLPTRGGAVLHQGGNEVVIDVGQIALYDTRRPYDLRLDGNWVCQVMTVPTDVLGLPLRSLPDLMARAHDTSEGPGSVLRSFLATSVDQYAGEGPGAALQRFGDAGASLLSSTLLHTDSPAVVERGGDNDAGREAMRLVVLDHLRRHLRNPTLSHLSVAGALGISPRTLDRLYEDQPRTVTATVRALRLEGARRELADPRSARFGVQAIAASWCFVDPSHFSRAFRAHFGMSPSQVRPGAADLA